MPTSTKKLKLFSLLFLMTLTLSVKEIASAQVVYDWSSNNKAPESYPKISRKQNVTFTITKVNDILYSYRLEVTEAPIESDDFKNIADIFKGFGGGRQLLALSPSCSELKENLLAAFKAAADEISADEKLPTGYAASGSDKSIPLDESISAWRSHAAVLAEAVKLEEQYKDQNCQLDEESTKLIEDFKQTVLEIDKRVNSPHVFVDDKVLSPGNNYSATVFEMYAGKEISSKTFTFPGTDILTLSAGALFSRIPDRLYEARKTPSGTENLLTVEGNSKATPSIVALLNYSLGALKLEGENFGLALSAGPVIRLGGKSDASSFGFFSGISAHLARRFYITPGLHFGQFSDFPVGFGNGSAVPANFGELNPVKRWTARFGLGITFKTKDFSGLVSSEAPKVTGTEAGNRENKPPADDDDAIKRALRSRIRKDPDRKPAARRSSPSPERRPQVDNNDEPNPFDENDKDEKRGPGLRISILRSSMSSADDRISINANGAIRDYATYFKSGRFYLRISHAQLEVTHDDLRGGFFSEPLFEQRGEDLVLSVVLIQGARVSFAQRTDGLELIIFRGDSR